MEYLCDRHPSHWTFIRCLKDEQGITESSVNAVNRGDAPVARRRKWGDLERRLIRLKQEYRNGVWKSTGIQFATAWFHIK